MGPGGDNIGQLPIGFDLRGLQPGFKAHLGRGLGREAHELALRLPLAAPDLELVGLVQGGLEQPDPRYLAGRPRITIRLPWPRGKAQDRLLGQELALPLAIRGRLSLVHHVAHLDAPALSPVPTVVTVNDLILSRQAGTLAKGGPARRLLRSLEAMAVRRARLVVAISQATGQEVEEYMGVNPNKVQVIPLAAGEQFKEVEDPGRLVDLRRRYDLREPYFLHVGGFDPRKNLVRLIRAWASLGKGGKERPRLVLAGPTRDRAQVAPVEKAVAEKGLRNRVSFIGAVDDGDLPLLYSAAQALVFPSLYEGFGLPALEAMACGCPVLAARTTSLPEVVGEAGLYFDPLDPRGIASAVNRLRGEPGLRDELRAKGFAQAALFTWDKTAEQLAQAYYQVLKGEAR